MIAFGIDLLICFAVVLVALVGQEYMRTKAKFDPAVHYEKGDTGVPQFFARFGESILDREPDITLLTYGIKRESTVAMPILLLVPWAIGLISHLVFGRSFGKVLTGLRVYTASGERISAGKASVRYFGKWLSALPVFVGYLMVFAGGKTLHDRLNGTMVGKA